MVETTNVIALGFIASFCASVGTAVGSVGVLFISSLSRKLEDILLSVAAGIMLAATFFSLLLPGLEFAGQQHGEILSVGIVSAGLLLGAVALFAIHQQVPHEHFQLGREGGDATELSRIWLFVIAITLHNFPEGMAVGVGFAGGELSNGLPLALGIGLQNIPGKIGVEPQFADNNRGSTTVLIRFDPYSLFTQLNDLPHSPTLLKWRESDPACR